MWRAKFLLDLFFLLCQCRRKRNFIRQAIEEDFPRISSLSDHRHPTKLYDEAASLGSLLFGSYRAPGHQSVRHSIFKTRRPSNLRARMSEQGNAAVADEGNHQITNSDSGASVLFVVPGSSTPSSFGSTSPEPSPSWLEVASHLSSRLPDFDDRIRSSVMTDDALVSASSNDVLPKPNIVVALGLADLPAQRLSIFSDDPDVNAIVCYACSSEVNSLQRIGTYRKSALGLDGTLQELRTDLSPWTDIAQGKRLSEQADSLFARNSSEDLLYAIFFILHAKVLDIPLVRHTVNPTWEKGPVRNALEFGKMLSCCSNEITAALTDPETKETIDLLNACDMRDQVGSYRVIVSRETPQLEEFSLCILQKNNCFGCDAKILENPRVPVLGKWRGEPLSDKTARQITIGHFNSEESHPSVSQKLPWSWKIVCGANPAYDAFPAQHQIFYPSNKSSSALWYDPVFKVETLDGRQIWTKRHYRCIPRQVPEDLRGESGTSAGAWTLTTLDNGVISKEHWTIVDAADDLSWAVFHYSGAAAVVGQSYLGALLCSPDGLWPAGAKSGEELERIRAAFRKCGIEFWELYGHGPPESGKSFMWTSEHAQWEKANPPNLAPIGDQSVQAWRAAEKAKSNACS